MTNEESVEYMGLAAALGRVMASLKQTEATLREVTAERDALKAQIAEASEK